MSKPTRGRTRGHRWVRLHDPIFRATHWVFFGPSRTFGAVAPAIVGAAIDPLPEGVAGTCAAMQHAGESVSTLTHVSSDLARHEHLETLIHELHHAMVYTLDASNVPMTRDTGELMAYYHEWLVREARKGVGL